MAHPCRHPRTEEILNGRKRKPHRDSAAVVAAYLERITNIDRTKAMRAAANRLDKVL